MVERLDNIAKAKEFINLVFDTVCNGEYGQSYNIVNDNIAVLNQVLTSLLNDLPFIQSLGIEFPKDIVLGQMNHFMEALEHHDSVLLIDSLVYELGDSIAFYEEIIHEMQKNNICFE